MTCESENFEDSEDLVSLTKKQLLSRLTVYGERLDEIGDLWAAGEIDYDTWWDFRNFHEDIRMRIVDELKKRQIVE